MSKNVTNEFFGHKHLGLYVLHNVLHVIKSTIYRKDIIFYNFLGGYYVKGQITKNLKGDKVLPDCFW